MSPHLHATNDEDDGRQPVWRSTKPEDELDYYCDAPGCTNRADSLSFWPWTTTAERCLLSCPDHWPGGYTVGLVRWFHRGDHDMQDHVSRKINGDHCIGLWGDRVEEALIRAARVPGVEP